MHGLMTEFTQTLRRLRGQILGWGIGLASYGLLMGAMFSSINQIEGLDELLANYPQEFLAFMGDVSTFSTPSGYFGTYFSNLVPLFLVIFAVSTAAGLLAGDEERGTLDLVMAYPLSRWALFAGRALGYIVALGLVLLISYLGWLVVLPWSGMDVSALQLLRPFVPLFGLMLLFGGLALLLSLLLPSARMASTVAGGLLVANFLLAGLAKINDSLQPIMDLTPFAFYQQGDAMDGLNWGWALGLMAVGLLFIVIAGFVFNRRDIRVGGEKGWSLG